MIYANGGAITVIASTMMELFDDCPAPSSPEMMIIIDGDTNMYTEWYNIVESVDSIIM